MIVYHYTARHLIAKIKQQGLCRGRLPWNLNRKTGVPEMRRGYQWLTTNASFEQPWCLLGSLPYPRNAYRITILVPPKCEKHVFKWSELVRRCRPDCADEINATGGDVENWRIYYGAIPTAWFLEISRNPGQAMAPDELLLPQG